MARDDLVVARDAVLLGAGALDFASALGAGATLALGGCAAWFWCVTTATALEAVRGVRRIELTGLRGCARRLVLAGCGVALAAGVAPAQADDPGSVAGQPPRPVADSVVTTVYPETHAVRRGESLWSITARRLGPGATDPEIDRGWRRLWHANAAIVGDDPDVIDPGQRLHVPEALR